MSSVEQRINRLFGKLDYTAKDNRITLPEGTVWVDYRAIPAMLTKSLHAGRMDGSGLDLSGLDDVVSSHFDEQHVTALDDAFQSGRLSVWSSQNLPLRSNAEPWELQLGKVRLGDFVNYASGFGVGVVADNVVVEVEYSSSIQAATTTAKKTKKTKKTPISVLRAERLAELVEENPKITTFTNPELTAWLLTLESESDRVLWKKVKNWVSRRGEDSAIPPKEAGRKKQVDTGI